MTRGGSKPVAAARLDGETGADAVARYVRRLVFEDVLTDGQRLPQDEIAAAIGVSRIPVREAIVVLEREGWLRVVPHRGAYVNGLDDQAVHDRFALYSRFYGFAARRAIERRTPDAIESLDGLASKIEAATNPTAFERANALYLRALVHLARSARLSSVLRSTAQIVPGNFFAVIPNAMATQRVGVAKLQAALEVGDADSAEQIFVDIEQRHALDVIALLNERRSAAARAER